MATVANITITIATYVYYGWNAVGGAVTARNTARFSAVLFAVALTAHFHRRFGRDYVPLIQAFIAAHVVHFGTVIGYHVILGALANPRFIVAASAGSILLAATALTITKAPRTHLGLTYVIWLAFMIAFGSNALKRPVVDGPFVVVVAVAMVVHVANAMRTRKVSSAASA